MTSDEISSYFANLDELTKLEIESRIGIEEYVCKLRNHASVLRIKAGKSIAGLIFYYVNENATYITHLSVLPSFRKSGYARAMLDELKRISNLPIVLEVSITNLAARKLYLGSGFSEVKSSDRIITMSTPSIRDYAKESADNQLKQYRHSVDSLVRKYFLERLGGLDLLGSGGKCLEVGSHDGSMTAQLLEYFSEVELIEPVTQFHQELRDLFGEKIQIHAGIASDFDFPMKYQSIFLVHVLEHMDDPITELNRLGNWLRPDGNLFIMVPNADAFSRQIAAKMGIMGNVEEVLPGEKLQGHLRTYTLDTLSHHVEKAGLRIKHIGGIMRKPMANFQLDSALESGIISIEFLDALNELSKSNPADASSIFIVAELESK